MLSYFDNFVTVATKAASAFGCRWQSAWMFVEGFRAAERIKHPILLVYKPVFCVAKSVT